MTGTVLASALSHDQFLIRQKVFKLFGQAFHVYDPAGNVVLYCKLKAFKLREDVSLFANEGEPAPVMRIRARSIIDFAAAYDVLDMTAESGEAAFQPGQTLEYAAHPEGGHKVGALRRKGLRSILRDAWEIMDPADRVIGVINEDSGLKAFVRRYVDLASAVMPQAFHAEVDGRRVFEMRQNFNPIVRKMTCDFSMDPQHTLDRRLGIAAAVLLMAVEGRQG
jgi:hypothetical protein